MDVNGNEYDDVDRICVAQNGIGGRLLWMGSMAGSCECTSEASDSAKCRERPVGLIDGLCCVTLVWSVNSFID